MGNKYELGSEVLMYVHSQAIDYMVKTQFLHSSDPYHPKLLDLPEIQRTYCFMNATIDYLRSQDLLAHLIEFKDKAGLNCVHALKNSEDRRGPCVECGREVYTVLVPKPEKV